MVNHGPSGGCHTCKQRRVKCDEARPKCWPCQRLNLRCGGYKKRPPSLKFIDQNHKFRNAFVPARTSRAQCRAAIPVPRPVAEPDTAVPFFLGHYASLGRYTGSARGFFELLIPMYNSQRQDSLFSLAISAVASQMLSVWQHGACGFQPPLKYYAQAIACLQTTIENPAERGQPATLLAILALQLYENIAAIFGLRLATCAHNDGAMSLLPFADLNRENGVLGAYVRRFMLHIEISSAMRQKRPLQMMAYTLIESRVLLDVPDNPSSTLDIIGASVADLQARYMQLGAHDGSAHRSQGALAEFRAEAKRIDGQLLAWARSVPDYWQPMKFTSGKDMDLSIPVYRSVCDVYPSCQIAAIWNLWRFQRLLLVKIILSSLDMVQFPNQFQCEDHEISSCKMEELVECKHTLQKLVDSVCYSVPFYLGNRTKLSRISDFTDPAIVFPSYHSLALGDKRRLNDQNGPMTSNDEHKRHVIAQGLWHAMSPLSRLLALFSEDHGQLITSFLRPGQREWICGQFLRVTTLLRLPQETTGYNKEDYSLFASSIQESIDTKAECLARAVRKGAIFMSGP